MRHVIILLISGVVLFLDGFHQLTRGYRILYKGERSLHWVVKARVAFLEAIAGQEAKEKYEKDLLQKRDWNYWGILGLIYGVSAMLAGIFFIFSALLD